MYTSPWHQWVKNLMSKAARRRRERRPLPRPKRPLLQVEVFEERVLPTVTSVFDMAHGILTVTSDADDPIAITRGADFNVKVNGAELTSGGPASAFAVNRIDITGGPGGSLIDLSAVVRTSFPVLRGVSVDGGGGDATLVAPDQANTWSITGTNAGQLNSLVTFQQVPNLTGGTGTDTFTFASGGLVTGVIDGREGALELRSTGNLEIANTVQSLGGKLTVSAGTGITVDAGVTISTRTIDPGDPATEPSTGDSGAILFTAPQITLNQDDQVFSFATTPFSAGDITFTATDSTGTSTGNTTTAQATIQLDGATLKGRNVSLSTTADSSKKFDDNGQVTDTQIKVLNFTAKAGAAIANAASTIQIGTGTVIDAATVALSATAKAAATVQTTNKDLAVAYGEANPAAQAMVADGATVYATGDFQIITSATSNTAVHGEQREIGQKRNRQLGLALAVSEADTQSLAQIGRGANVTVGGNLQVEVRMDKHLNTTVEAGTFQEGSVGTGVALSHSSSNVRALVGGMIAVTGSVIITATSTTPDGTTIADASQRQVNPASRPQLVPQNNNLDVAYAGSPSPS
jgi:hypothetical protein